MARSPRELILVTDLRRTITIPKSDLADKGTVSFSFEASGWPVEGFLYREGDVFYAYVNRCKHLPLTLDLGTEEFFTQDGAFFLCANHGARFAPTTGECVWGPCLGKHLSPIPIDTNDPNHIVVDITDVDRDRPPPPDLD